MSLRPHALVVIRKGKELIYIHDRELASRALFPLETAFLPSLALGCVVDTAIQVRSMTGQQFGMQVKDFNDVLFRLRKCEPRAPAPLVKRLRQLGSASDFLCHSCEDDLGQLMRELHDFLASAVPLANESDGVCDVAQEPPQTGC